MPDPPTSPVPQQPLRRELGTVAAAMLGLGSILGTGVFVSIGLAAGIAGPLVILAIVLAAVLATCNGLSSAQLAASHPVAGGTYEYGYRYLNPTLGFTAGWMFLCAKSASAATAALGFAGYLLVVASPGEAGSLLPIALAVIVIVTVLVLTGVRRSSHVNTMIASITIIALAAFIIGGLPAARESGEENLRLALDGGGSTTGLLHATALMFVAYTGYGRVATLGEEVREPQRTIPRAIILTLAVSMALYVGVATVAVASVGAAEFAAATADRAAPLATIARTFGVPGLPLLLAAGAITAMLGVLLNLVLGLSRVLLAMGRRGDMPRATARLDAAGASPRIATIVVGVIIAGLVAIGDIRVTWSFSAFTVLVYYALTNLAALRLPAASRRYPRWIAWCGLAGCLGVAFFVPRSIWLAGTALIGAGLVWHALARRAAHRQTAI
ncbi:MAG: APC family permease [Planctomycetota bacterium]|jgi:APA family basic amino acid/polyamine antiporter